MTDRQIMQQALEALELLARCEHPLTKIQVRKPRDGGSIVTVYPHQVATDAAELLRERLAQPEQCKYPDCKCATENPCLKGLAQPLRTHWDGCEEVHPECKQPEQEPVAAWDGAYQFEIGNLSVYKNASSTWKLLYTTPPRREWVGLTDDEIYDMYNEPRSDAEMVEFARAIEAKLREKNA